MVRMRILLTLCWLDLDRMLLETLEVSVVLVDWLADEWHVAVSLQVWRVHGSWWGNCSPIWVVVRVLSILHCWWFNSLWLEILRWLRLIFKWTHRFVFSLDKTDITLYIMSVSIGSFGLNGGASSVW